MDADQTERPDAAPVEESQDTTSQAAAPRDLTAIAAKVRRLAAVLFFLLLAAHLTVNLTPRVLYGADEISPVGKNVPTFPVYFRGGQFFKPFLKTPGGLVEYLGANLSQYFAVPHGGAVILVAVAIIAFWLTDGLVGLMGGRKGNVARLAVPLLLVVVWNRYTFLLADQLSLLGVLLAACAYLRLPEKSVVRAAVMAPGIVAFYYVAGAPAILLAAVCGTYELIAKRRDVGGLYLLVGALTPLVLGCGLFKLSTSDAYLLRAGLKGGLVSSVAMGVLYGFMILLTVVLALREWRHRSAEAGDGGSAEAASPGAMQAVVIPLAVVALAVAAGLTTLDRDLRAFRRICFASQANASGATILAIQDYPAALYTADTCRRLNRALYDEGQLGRRMFAFPQSPDGGLMPMPGLYAPYKSDTLLQLGAVDSAERLARASLAQWGPRPFVLKLLAKIAIVKSDWVAAEGYLTTLANDVVHGAAAQELLAKIKAGDRFHDDPEISRIRSNWLVGHEYDPRNTQKTLEDLVFRRNDQNQMAFEYLMAHYLLTLQVGTFAEKVDHLRSFGYDYMPPQFAEALVLFYSQTNQWEAIEGLQRDPQTLERSQRFVALVREHRGDTVALAEAIALEMPASYFGYYFAAMRQLAQRQAAMPRP